MYVLMWWDYFVYKPTTTTNKEKSKVKFVLFNTLIFILSSVIGRHSYGHVDTLFRRKPAAAT